MHLVGPEGFERRPDLCEQYQCLAVTPDGWTVTVEPGADASCLFSVVVFYDVLQY